MSLWKSLGAVVVLATVMVPSRAQDGDNTNSYSSSSSSSQACFNADKPYGKRGTFGTMQRECQNRPEVRGQPFPTTKCVFEKFGGFDDAEQILSYDVISRAANHFANENYRASVLRGLNRCENRAKQSQNPVDEYFHCISDSVVKVCPEFRTT